MTESRPSLYNGGILTSGNWELVIRWTTSFVSHTSPLEERSGGRCRKSFPKFRERGGRGG